MGFSFIWGKWLLLSSAEHQLKPHSVRKVSDGAMKVLDGVRKVLDGVRKVSDAFR